MSPPNIKYNSVAYYVIQYCYTLFLSYANDVVLVGQMPAVHRKVHRLHGARRALEILKAPGWRPLSKLYLSDLYTNSCLVCATNTTCRCLYYNYIH